MNYMRAFAYNEEMLERSKKTMEEYSIINMKKVFESRAIIEEVSEIIAIINAYSAVKGIYSDFGTIKDLAEEIEFVIREEPSYMDDATLRRGIMSLKIAISHK